MNPGTPLPAGPGADLEGRADDLEARARTATAGQWRVRQLGRRDQAAIVPGDATLNGMPDGLSLASFYGPNAAADAVHAARLDPQWALRLVSALREISRKAAEQPGYDLGPGVHDGRDYGEQRRDEAVKEALDDVVATLAGVWEETP